jgi:pimeloyl-ACP methyl ester carboxylesterase
LEKSPLVFILLIFSILVVSSSYLSWTSDRGLGELTVERFNVEREPGRPVDFLVYTPRVASYESPMPVILTTHGVAGSKEGMYSFNVELARRNFTVISIDNPGHGDNSLPFNITEFDEIAKDCYYALQYVSSIRDDIDNSTYGVLTHSHGFHTALEMREFPIAPSAFVSVGSTGEMGLGVVDEYPGNLLLSIGQFDEMISNEAAIAVLRRATGNESAEPNITYGSFENKTAVRLAFAPTEHVFEAIDSTVVTDSIEWFIQALQGVPQLERTLDPTAQVYQLKVYASAIGAFALLTSTIPLVLLLTRLLPGKLKPAPLENNVVSLSIGTTLVRSSVLGIVMIGLFTITSVVGYQLEVNGVAIPRSMFATGLFMFLLLAPFLMFILMRIMFGKENAKLAFTSIGIEKKDIKLTSKRIVGGSVVSIIGAIWLLSWKYLGSNPAAMHPWIAFSLVVVPVGVRIWNILILTLAGIPFFIADAAWIRGLLLSKREWNTTHPHAYSILLVLIGRLPATAAMAVIVVALTTGLGLVIGAMVLLGLLLLLFMVVSILSTLLITLSSIEFENPWPVIILSSFILAWVAISSVPLI